MIRFNTPLEALYACRNHWSWLAITGSDFKRSYKPSIYWIAGCACCDSVYSCKNCPLASYAWKRHCLISGDSLFKKWNKSKTKRTREKYAYKMVQACNHAIEDILLNSSDGGTHHYVMETTEEIEKKLVEVDR